jgi:hypothetical protein
LRRCGVRDRLPPAQNRVKSSTKQESYPQIGKPDFDGGSIEVGYSGLFTLDPEVSVLHQRIDVLAFVVSSLGLALVANAQPINTPKFFLWPEYPESSFGSFTPSAGPSSDKVKKIVRFNLGARYLVSPPSTYAYYRDHPDVLAEHIADWIAAEQTTSPLPRLSASDTSNDEIVVLLERFGADSVECDALENQPEPLLGGTRFFQPSDRLNLLINEWNTVNQDPQFPVRRGISGEDRAARSYRHPFLKNAKQDADAALRTWMQTFVNRLDQVYYERQGFANAIPHPSTFRYYNDVEAFLVSEGDANGVWILDYLANPAQYNDSTNTYWNNSNYLVPGSGGKTLQQCYNEYRTQYGF